MENPAMSLNSFISFHFISLIGIGLICLVIWLQVWTEWVFSNWARRRKSCWISRWSTRTNLLTRQGFTFHIRAPSASSVGCLTRPISCCVTPSITPWSSVCSEIPSNTGSLYASQQLLAWKLSPVVFYRWITLRNTTGLSFQPNTSTDFSSVHFNSFQSDLLLPSVGLLFVSLTSTWSSTVV